MSKFLSFAKECPEPNKLVSAIKEHFTEPQNGLSIKQIQLFAYLSLMTSDKFKDSVNALNKAYDNAQITNNFINDSLKRMKTKYKIILLDITSINFHSYDNHIPIDEDLFFIFDGLMQLVSHSSEELDTFIEDVLPEKYVEYFLAVINKEAITEYTIIYDLLPFQLTYKLNNYTDHEDVSVSSFDDMVENIKSLACNFVEGKPYTDGPIPLPKFVYVNNSVDETEIPTTDTVDNNDWIECNGVKPHLPNSTIIEALLSRLN